MIIQIGVEPFHSPGKLKGLNFSAYVSGRKHRIGRASLCLGGSRCASLYKLWVSPKYRNQGVATKIIHECCQYAILKEREAINLIVAKRNPGVEPFYEKLGFRMTFQYANGDLMMTKFLT